MKVLSWFGALILFVAVAAGTSSVLRLHSQTKPSLVADRTVAAATTPAAEQAAAQATPSPTPQPSATPAKHPAKPAAKPPAKPVMRAPVPRPTVAASVVVVSEQQRLINLDRKSHGIRPLIWSSCLSSIASSNAVRMANQGFRDLGCHLGTYAGENVGYWSGGGLTQAQLDAKLNSMFMNSAGHRANILSPYYHYVGTAWKTAPNGSHYIAVEFS